KLRIDIGEHDRRVRPEVRPVLDEEVEGHVGQYEDQGGLALAVFPEQEGRELPLEFLSLEAIRVHSLGIELERTNAGLRQNLPDVAVEALARRQHHLRAGKYSDPPGGDRVRSFGQSRRRSDKQGHQACRNGTHSSIRLNGANLSPPPGRGFGTTWTISDGSY